MPTQARPDLTTAPALPEAVINQLIALFNAGRYAELEASALALLQQNPESGFAWKAYGIALQMQGKNALIALQTAARMLPGDAEVLSNMGNALLSASQLDAAVACYRQALTINPALAEAHCNLGNVLNQLGQRDAAVTICRRALVINPDFVNAHNNLGNALRDLDMLEEAASAYKQALTLYPELAEAHSNLGQLFRKQGHVVEAEFSARHALELKPNSYEAIVFMAELQADKGLFGEAEALYRCAILIDSNAPEAWAGISRIHKMTSDDGDWLRAAQHIATHKLPPRKSVQLHYAMGKYYDDTKDFDLAFAHYRQANALSKQYTASYSPEQQTRATNMLIDTYSREWIAQHQSNGDASSRPVFIVGMPRSGTSLAEQILASHPSAHGAGELPYWNNVAASDQSAQSFSKLAQDYLQVLTASSDDALRIIDKMPSNFLTLGLIHAALPNARIVHMQRNPADTCLSIYFQNFESQHSYANDLDNLAHYYKEYLRIMGHWHQALPAGTILDVSYEVLVDDQEGMTRKMLAFIGLPWDERCLDFHLKQRAVGTSSNWQVRQKISKSSVERWRNYEKHIKSLLL